jgi:hypothetical protein
MGERARIAPGHRVTFDAGAQALPRDVQVMGILTFPHP